MKPRLLDPILRISLYSLCLARIQAQAVEAKDAVIREYSQTDSPPVVLGQGAERFRVGPEVFRENFVNLNNWIVQIQDKKARLPASVQVRNKTLDCLLPSRGCTIWLKKKLQTRVAITYSVLCPTPAPNLEGVHVRDINNFWMASDPLDAEEGLFDSTSYTGAFGTYDKMHGYYASTGGGSKTKANITTRMRRYPREIKGKPSPHIALSDKDGKPGYLITPNRVMRIQLVAFDDLIQYIVDGKLIYEIGEGDPIKVEGRDKFDNPTITDATYDKGRFPVYTEGFFGFRMVGTHHIYSDVRIYSLLPTDSKSAHPNSSIEF